MHACAAEDVVLTRMNGPKDRVFEWFIEPLLIMKEQLKNLELEETEESCLKELVMRCKNELPEEWDSTGFPSDDTVRRAQLQAIIRRYYCMLFWIQTRRVFMSFSTKI